MKKKAVITLIIIALIGAVLFACKEEHSHQFGEWQNDENYHWKQCSCGDTTDYDTHNYGNDGVCTDCKYKKSQIPSHTHSFDKRDFNSEYHWLECSCGDKIDYEFHDEGEWSCPTCNYRKYTEDLIYELNEDGLSYTVIGIESKEHTSIVIPSSHEGKPVTIVKYKAFEDCNDITSITIPNTIKSFWSTFEYRSNPNFSKVNYLGDLTDWLELAYEGFVYTEYDLYFNDELITDVVFPEGTEYIDSSAFRFCKSLTSITIPSSVKYIGYDVFDWCENLVKVNITDLEAWCNIDFSSHDWDLSGNPLTFSLACLYLNDELITDLIIPDSVTTIKSFAFAGCKNLTSLTIGNNVTVIENNAFYYCTGLTNITIGKKVERIENNAFLFCEKLVEVYNLSDMNITKQNQLNGYLGYYALNIYTDKEGESKLVKQDDFLFFNGDEVYLLDYLGNDAEITLPNTFNGKPYSIYQYAFYSHINLTSIVIPEGFTSIKEGVFYNCINLKHLSIPNSLTFIENDAFEACIKLEYNEYDNALYLGNNSNPYIILIRAKNKEIASCSIHSGTKIINEYAFYDCEKLKSVALHNSLVYIGYNAFAYCENLIDITLPKSLTYIGSSAFYNCKSLTEINIPDNITQIERWTFKGCAKLTNVIYKGTISEWNEIKKGIYWDEDTGDYIITCSDGVITKDGNYILN